jgi:xylose isomerase
VDRFITLWEMAGEVLEDAVIKEATAALRAGSGVSSNDPRELFEANKELMTLHELIGHRLLQILLGLHRGRVYSL